MRFAVVVVSAATLMAVSVGHAQQNCRTASGDSLGPWCSPKKPVYTAQAINASQPLAPNAAPAPRSSAASPSDVAPPASPLSAAPQYDPSLVPSGVTAAGCAVGCAAGCDAGCAAGCDGCGGGCDLGCDGGCGAGCGDGCGGGCGDGCCTPHDRSWFSAEYMWWWMEGYNTPDLVVASPGGPVLYGDERTNTDVNDGVRFQSGRWADCSRTCGIMFDTYSINLNGTDEFFEGPVFRPFYNADPDAMGPAFQRADEIRVRTDGKLDSFGFACRNNIWCCSEPVCCDSGCDSGCGGGCDAGCGGGCDLACDGGCDSGCGGGCCCEVRTHRIDRICGVRYWRLDEGLNISESASLPPPLVTTFDLEDRFATDNRFYGWELGLIGTKTRGPWLFEWVGKAAIGWNHEEVEISGMNVTVPAINAPAAGLLAQPSNIGRETSDRFAVLSEVGAKLGYRITENMRATVGYSFIYLTHAVRPGDQIDPTVDGRWLEPSFVPPGTPPATRPAPRFNGSGLWLQGVNVGLLYNY